MITKGKNHQVDPRGAEFVSTTSRTRMAALAAECAVEPIVVACDEAYAMPLSTTLRSLAESNQSSGQLNVFVLTTEFSARAKENVLRSLPSGSVAIHWVPVDLGSFEGFSTQPYISKMTYARLLLPDIFSHNVPRILYLDVDVLVLGDLSPLWAIDLEGAALGAVVDTYSEDHGTRLRLVKTSESTEIGGDNAAPAHHYFNAGVLLVDLHRWRQERISERAFEYLAQYPDSILSDQDALNVACAGRWKQLDMRWNHQIHDAEGYGQMASEQRPSIIHFAGKRKPWLATYLNVNAAFYDDFRSRTQFARGPFDKVLDGIMTFWLRSRRFLRQYKAVFLVYKYTTRLSKTQR